MKGSQITATRGEETKVRNRKKFKLLKERPADLRRRGSGKEVPEEDSDWEFDLKRRKPAEEEVGSTGEAEPESSFDEADYEITYRTDQGEEQQTVHRKEKEQEKGKVYTRSGREVRPRERLGEVEKVRLSPRNRKRRMTEAKRAQKEGRK